MRGFLRRNEPWIALAICLLGVVAISLAHAQTPEPEDPAIVALSNDLTASTVANGHMVQSLRALVQAYQAEKAKLAAAQKRAAELEAYWKAYIAEAPKPAP